MASIECIKTKGEDDREVIVIITRPGIDVSTLRRRATIPGLGRASTAEGETVTPAKNRGFIIVSTEEQLQRDS